MPKLILHAGMPKTGTSTIQSTLSEDGWGGFLDEQEIRYLKHQSIEENHSGYFNALRGYPRWIPAEEHDHSVNLFTEAISTAKRNASPDHSILISAESVSDIARNEEHLALVEHFISRYFSCVSIIVYVREPLSFMCSRMQQALKSAYPMDEHVVENAIASADCTAFLPNLRRVFGYTNVTIRSFDPGMLIDGDIVTDFCLGALALPDSPQLRQRISESISGNFSAPPEFIEILMLLYEHKQISPETFRAEEPFYQTLYAIQWKGDVRFGIDFFPQEIRQHISEAADSLRERARDYLGYDCFPTYQHIELDTPGDIRSARHAIETFHYISRVFKEILYECGESQSGKDIQYGESESDSYAETREEAKSRAYQLLECFYELCNERQG